MLRLRKNCANGESAIRDLEDENTEWRFSRSIDRFERLTLVSTYGHRCPAMNGLAKPSLAANDGTPLICGRIKRERLDSGVLFSAATT